MGSAVLSGSEEVLDVYLLGELLTGRRQQLGRTLQDLRTATGFTVEQIQEVEAGHHDLSPALLAELLKQYQIPSPTGRLSGLAVEIDLGRGQVTLSSNRRVWSNHPDADQNLIAYLSLLYGYNGIAAGTGLPLKYIDLSLLRSSLALRRDAVTEHIGRSFAPLSPGGRRKRSLLAAAATAGVAVAAGALVLIPASTVDTPANPAVASDGSAGETAERSNTIVDPRIDIGTAVVIERSAEEARQDTAANFAVQPADSPPKPATPEPELIERPLDQRAPRTATTPRTSRGPPVEEPGLLSTKEKADS